MNVGLAPFKAKTRLPRQAVRTLPALFSIPQSTMRYLLLLLSSSSSCRLTSGLLLATLLCTCGRAPVTVATPAAGGARTTDSTENRLQAGPMLGYNEQREVAVWVQTTRPATVQLAYRGAGGDFTTDPVQTEKSSAYTATLIADAVQPGEAYTYDVLIDGRRQPLPYPTEFTAQTLWRYRGGPPDFSVAVGSCTYVNEERYDRPGNGYGRGYGIFESIDARNPELMIWLGDNNYLREPDWSTRTGYHHRYTHSRSIPELQPLLARTHHYAIWDDHDYGPNDSDRSWGHRELAGETFDLFWANPASGLPTSRQAYGADGITTSFRYGDVDFFLLDNRSFRTPNDQVRKDNRHPARRTSVGLARRKLNVYSQATLEDRMRRRPGTQHRRSLGKLRQPGPQRAPLPAGPDHRGKHRRRRLRDRRPPPHRAQRATPTER